MKKANVVLLGLAVVIIGYLLVGSTRSDVQANSQKTTPAKTVQLQTMKNNLLGKQVRALKTVLGDSLSSGSTGDLILFLFSNTDCFTCIDKGFQVAQYLQSLQHTPRLFVVLPDTVFSQRLAKQTGYDGPLFEDATESIRKELNYLLTPVFIVVDAATLHIQNLYFPLPSGDETMQADFLDDVMLRNSPSGLLQTDD